ncbi:hypothetical protein [Micromonospora sp. NBS 11-29]|nr:hypothetical protein [Micromonospora sp. NBS 11-29]
MASIPAYDDHATVAVHDDRRELPTSVTGAGRSGAPGELRRARPLIRAAR